MHQIALIWIYKKIDIMFTKTSNTFDSIFKYNIPKLFTSSRPDVCGVMEQQIYLHDGDLNPMTDPQIVIKNRFDESNTVLYINQDTGFTRQFYI